MINGKNSTTGTTRRGKNVKEVKITDKFKRMMDKALPAARLVLEKRKEDLEKWGAEEQKEFYNKFGISGDTPFTHRFEICTDLTRGTVLQGGATEQTTALAFMRQSVDRMIVIMNALYVGERKLRTQGENENFEPHEVYKYGSFVNKTYDSQFSASVLNTGTQYCAPSQYKDYLEVNIGNRFVNKALVGPDSMASILCHEVSHFNRLVYRPLSKDVTSDDMQLYEGSWGGLGTQDLSGDNLDHKNDSTYTQYADNLKYSHNVKVFNNAYNIERYFEVEI